MKIDGVLQKITALIVQSCNPERIVLFGSHAKGQANLESDLDILVIGDFHKSRFLRGQELRELLHFYPIRIDLHVVTQEEVDAESVRPFGFLSSALASGMCLYLRENMRVP